MMAGGGHGQRRALTYLVKPLFSSPPPPPPPQQQSIRARALIVDDKVVTGRLQFYCRVLHRSARVMILSGDDTDGTVSSFAKPFHPLSVNDLRKAKNGVCQSVVVASMDQESKSQVLIPWSILANS